MARPDKVAAVEEVRDGLAGSAATLLTHYRGLSVTEIADLRGRLRATEARYRVVKNTLSRRAVREAGVEGLAELIDGPVALVFCDQDPVGPAKVLKEFAREHPDLLVRGGYLDGEVLDEAAAAGLADLSSREELLAKLAGLMDGALSGFARLLRAPVEHQARLVQALVDAGGASAPQSADAPGEPAERAERQQSPGSTTDEAVEESPDPDDAPAEDQS